jgi:molybdopterin molybdotransferase
MISLDEAVALIRSAAKPLGRERSMLAQAAGRVLARPVIAQIDAPRADVSAMDGYAVRSADLAASPASLKVIGESFPGSGWAGTVEPGTCVRIFTGAPVPMGADRIVMQENVRREEDLVSIQPDAGKARHIRERGSDFRAGGELLAPGRVLDERAIVAAAAADMAEIDVFRQPRVHVLSTGDELAAPVRARALPDLVPDSVSLGIAWLAERWGGRCVARMTLKDELAEMESAAQAALETADVIVVTGGASVGERDFAKAMFAPHGLERIFSKVAMRPGKPAWLGRAAGKLVVGLPGNPTSALVTGRLLLAPLLAGMTGRDLNVALAWETALLAAPLPSCDERETFHRARWIDGLVEVLPFQDSSAQKALAEADVLVRQRANSPAIAAGSPVDALRF